MDTHKSSIIQNKNDCVAARIGRWRSRVLDGEMDYRIETRIERDAIYQASLLEDFNSLLSSIHGMDGIKMLPLSYGKKNKHDKIRILKMVEMAKHGKIPYMWMGGEMRTFELSSALSCRPPREGLIAFYKWYEGEMRSHGDPSTTILADVSPDGYPITWYFAEGTMFPEQHRRLW